MDALFILASNTRIVHNDVKLVFSLKTLSYSRVVVKISRMGRDAYSTYLSVEACLWAYAQCKE